MHGNLKQRLSSGESLLGTFVKTPSAMVCEVLSQAPLDCVCLDAEHAPFGRMELDLCLHALGSGGMPSLVRVPAARPEYVLNALDCGATGILVPHIRNADEARAMAAAAHFGPGGRGYAGSTRAAGYGAKSIPEHVADSRSNTLVIGQIEDAEALDHLDEIAGVADLDCLFIGRIDLTLSLGADSPNAPEVIEAVERICTAGVNAGRPVGMFVANVEECRRWRAMGASLFLLESDHTFLLRGARDLRNRFGDTAPQN